MHDRYMYSEDKGFLTVSWQKSKAGVGPESVIRSQGQKILMPFLKSELEEEWINNEDLQSSSEDEWTPSENYDSSCRA